MLTGRLFSSYDRVMADQTAFRLVEVGTGQSPRIWKLIFDLPGEKVNKLGAVVLGELEGLLSELERKGKAGEIDALILASGKPGNFIAGADIEMIRACKTEQEAQALSRKGQLYMERWEDLPFVTVAAIDGAALGGGCEFSLACTAMVVSTSPAVRVGLPEVMLGVVPGMGGCVRLPRKVGLANALDWILSSKSLNGERAYKGGLADALIPQEDFESSAVRWVAQNLGALKAGERLGKEPKLGGAGGAIGTALEKTPIGRSVILKKARSGVMEKTRGNYPAALEVIEILSDNGASYGPRLTGEDRTRAMERESQGFGRAAATEVSKNLIRIFFMTEAVKKSKGVSGGAGAQIKSKSVRAGAVLGAGVMGGGIAQLMADKGVPVRMKDLTVAALAAGATQASRIFKKQVQRRRISSRELMQKMNLIAPVMDFSGFAGTEFVVEAVVEKMEIKQAVLKEVETQVGPDCVIASNTSSLSISKMQSAMAKPERFGGMHFFNPVNKMPLIEVIRGDRTSDEAVSAIYQFSKQLGKTPIVVKDAPGFLVNRLLMPYLNEATWLLQDGASIPEIDEALLEFGMPMGPIDLIDEVGIDVGEKVAHILHDAFGKRMEPAPFNQKLVDAGRFGKKNGKGFYKYDSAGRNPELEDSIYELIGITPREGTVSREEIVERCLLPMINEAARCLEESIVGTAEEVDLGMIMGTGFPPFRGGLLRYADTLGPTKIVEMLRKYEPKCGERFKPAPILLKLAASGQGFYSFNFKANG